MKKALTILITILAFSLLAGDESLLWPVEIGGMLFSNMETALNTKDRTKGLMFRKELPDDGGMIFLFDKPEKHSFWMRNTLIPLDIIFLDAKGKIDSMHTMKPEKPQGKDESEEDYCDRLRSYPSKGKVIAAIELNAGMVASLGLKVGDQVEIYMEDLAKHLK